MARGRSRRPGVSPDCPHSAQSSSKAERSPSFRRQQPALRQSHAAYTDSSATPRAYSCRPHSFNSGDSDIPPTPDLEDSPASVEGEGDPWHHGFHRSSEAAHLEVVASERVLHIEVAQLMSSRLSPTTTANRTSSPGGLPNRRPTQCPHSSLTALQLGPETMVKRRTRHEGGTRAPGSRRPSRSPDPLVWVMGSIFDEQEKLESAWTR